MKIHYYILNTLYNFFIFLFLLFSLVFSGILADEGVQVNQFTRANFFGLSINYNFVTISIFILMIMTLLMLILNIKEVVSTIKKG